ncbi:MAG TPA: hypothetical protein VGT01_09300 [Candidatus Dormibacteraeota bacterium]|nr:hypothetical protein [Candidatus Dormibacteraeota bacterium]
MRKDTRITRMVFGRPFPPVMATDIGGAIVYVFVGFALLLAKAGRVRIDRLVPVRVPVRR